MTTLSPELKWKLGISERGIVVSEMFAGALRVVVFGPVPSARKLDATLGEVAEGALRTGLRSAVPKKDVGEDMERTAQAVDVAIRRAIGDGHPEGRGTMVAATLREGEILIAQTGHGAALLVRGDLVEPIVAVGDHTTSEWHPWIGSRREGDEENPLLLNSTTEPLQLEPGDRIVLTSAPTAQLGALPALTEIVCTGGPEVAALSLSDVLRVQCGLADIAVAVLDWDRAPPEDTLLVDNDLFAGLASLITDITEDLDIDPPTPPFAPEREIEPLDAILDDFPPPPTDEHAQTEPFAIDAPEPEALADLNEDVAAVPSTTEEEPGAEAPVGEVAPSDPNAPDSAPTSAEGAPLPVPPPTDESPVIPPASDPDPPDDTTTGGLPVGLLVGAVLVVLGALGAATLLL